MTQPPEGYTRIIGDIVEDGVVVPRTLGQSATSSTNPELHAKLEALNPRRPFKRPVEVMLDEEMVRALARWISEDHKGRLREEDAVALLVREGLVGLGLLKPR